jgi:hypothetical protein
MVSDVGASWGWLEDYRPGVAKVLKAHLKWHRV